MDDIYVIEDNSENTLLEVSIKIKSFFDKNNIEYEISDVIKFNKTLKSHIIENLN